MFFAERALSLFADLFNHELLFRVWDFAFLEGSAVNANKYPYFLTAVLVTFLHAHANSMMKVCKTKSDIDLYLSLAAKFDLDCDSFIAASVALYYSYLQADTAKFPNAAQHAPPQELITQALQMQSISEQSLSNSNLYSASSSA